MATVHNRSRTIVLAICCAGLVEVVGCATAAEADPAEPEAEFPTVSVSARDAGTACESELDSLNDEVQPLDGRTPSLGPLADVSVGPVDASDAVSVGSVDASDAVSVGPVDASDAVSAPDTSPVRPAVSAGFEFVVAVPPVLGGWAAVYLHNPGSETASVVFALSETKDTFSLEAGETATRFFETIPPTPFGAGPAVTVVPAVRVSSSSPLVASVAAPPGSVASGDSMGLIPRGNMGLRHRLPSLADGGPGARQYVVVVSTEAHNTVTLSPPPGRWFFASASPGVVPGDEGVVKLYLGLSEAAILYADSALENDVSGTIVESSAPVAILAGVLGTLGPSCAACCCADTIITTVPPVSAWGRQHVAFDVGATEAIPDMIRVLSDSAGAVTVTSNEGVTGHWLDAGGVLELGLDKPIIVDSDMPVGVFQYIPVAGSLAGGITGTTPNCGEIDNPSDPSLFTLVPVEAWRTESVGEVGIAMSEGAKAYCADVIAVAAPASAWDSMKLDQQPVEVSWSTDVGPFRVGLIPAAPGMRRVAAEGPLSAYAYSYDTYGSIAAAMPLLLGVNE